MKFNCLVLNKRSINHFLLCAAASLFLIYVASSSGRGRIQHRR
jgi:hypothetical protein